MKKRYLKDDVKKLALNRHKMAFISGPRQVGKTTLSKSYQLDYKEFNYKNWDETNFRKIWTQSPNQLNEEFHLENYKSKKLLVLDEIHKAKGWKQKLKGLYDVLSEDICILVTGSARLNIYQKGGDSLMGRYINFRLHPFSYGELTNSRLLSPLNWRDSRFLKPKTKLQQNVIEKLFIYSGFPEPYFSESEKILRIWRRGRNEKIIREDLRDLSRLPELSQIEMLTSLLPSKVGNPLSVQSLRVDLEVSHDTVKRWLTYLKELYYFFEIKPWSSSIPRTLKKEGKIYLYDWTEIENIGAKFENLVACHLVKACHYWTDIGEGIFDLYYLRNKDKQEIDFLITNDKKPWLCIEAKYSDTSMNHKTFDKFNKYLQCPMIQVVHQKNIWKIIGENKLICSASHLFSGLP